MTKSTVTNWTVGNLTISNTAGTPARLELTGTQPLSTSVTNLTMTGGNFQGWRRGLGFDGEWLDCHQRRHV